MPTVQKTRIAVIRSLPRYSAEAQRHALAECGCGTWIDLTGHDARRTLVGVIRRGDTIHVRHLHLLAEPKRRTDDNPRRSLWEIVSEIEARGATIVEVSTGRSTSDAGQRDVMIADAIEIVTRGAKALPRRVARENGLLGGRPKKWGPEHLAAAAPVWFDLSLWGKSLDRALKRGGHPPRGTLAKRPPVGLGPRSGIGKD